MGEEVVSCGTKKNRRWNNHESARGRCVCVQLRRTEIRVCARVKEKHA